MPGARPAMAGGSPEADGPDGPERRGGRDASGKVGAVAARRSEETAVAETGRGEPAHLRRLRQPEVVFVAVLCAVATVAFGIWPDPLFDLARDAGASIASLV